MAPTKPDSPTRASCPGQRGRGNRLDPYWDLSGRHPYLVEWPTIIASAWFGGIGPGLLTVALASLAIVSFWIDPVHLHLSRPADRVAVVLLVQWGAGARPRDLAGRASLGRHAGT